MGNHKDLTPKEIYLLDKDRGFSFGCKIISR